MSDINPLLADWTAPYALPPFDTVAPGHFRPAFAVAMREHLAQLDAIADDETAPTVDNLLVPFDQSGRLLKRMTLLFRNLAGSETSDELQAVEREMAPVLAAHRNAIYLNARLFARIRTLHADIGTMAGDGEDRRMLARIYRDFVRAGANLTGADRVRYAQIDEGLATLTTRFGQNVLSDEAGFRLPLTSSNDEAGLPASLLDAAGEAARARGLPAGSRIVTLSPSMAEPFLTLSACRDLRERLWRARVARGAAPGDSDNRAIAAEILTLRQEKALLLGYATYADYQISDRMADSPQAASALLARTWEPALQQAEADRARLTEMAERLGEPTPVAAWDWMYLAEKVRQQSFDLDEAQVREYFSLDKMIQAAFDCATRLFGVRFAERSDIPLYHPDARLWEVRHRDGRVMGIFIGDYFARQTKRSGAWTSEFRSQSAMAGGTIPIVVNNNNFAKGTPTLLSFDDVTTLFHEFGHALHGLLSAARYERLAGTSVPGDFVEFPSQIFENWAQDATVLARHATHWRTGESIPAPLLARLQAARQFNQAYATIQYVAPAMIDLALHQHTGETPIDVVAFEAGECRRLGVPPDIGLRHYVTHFQHLFAGNGYAAGYYVYMWADVLAADGFAAFEAAGDLFDAETAERLYRYVYSAGGTIDPAQAYRAYRGRDPKIEPMLRQRGLLAPSSVSA